MNGKGTKHNNPVHNFNLKSPYPLNTINNECWNWLGAKDKDGYGVFTLDGKKTPAHVAAYKLSIGPAFLGHYVLHKCNNTSCVNPLHLYSGTQKDNIQDQITAGTFVRGSKNGKALLNETDVKHIRTSTFGTRQLATYYGVSYHTIWDIKRKRSWKHI